MGETTVTLGHLGLLAAASLGTLLLFLLLTEAGRRFGRGEGTRTLVFRTDPSVRFVKTVRRTEG